MDFTTEKGVFRPSHLSEELNVIWHAVMHHKVKIFPVVNGENHVCIKRASTPWFQMSA